MIIEVCLLTGICYDVYCMISLIFEVCMLTGICYVIYRKISSHWNPQERYYGNLRRLARGVGVFLLAVVVLEPQQNIKYYVSIIFNSPFLLLVSINTILVLAFLSSGSVKYFVGGGDVKHKCIKWLVISCINVLILDVYTFAQHWDHIGTDPLPPLRHNERRWPKARVN